MAITGCQQVNRQRVERKPGVKPAKPGYEERDSGYSGKLSQEEIYLCPKNS